MTIHTFSANPPMIRFGESTTLSWTTQGAEAVYLNWRGVPHQGQEIVTPIVTTTYLLHVARDDGSSESRALTVMVEGDVPAPDTVTRPPTVRLTPENVALLQRYPRPPRDNGRGLHFDLGLTDEGIARCVERLRYINATWTLIYAPDEQQARRAAIACWRVGIMPVIRIAKQVDEFVNPLPFVEALHDAGIPAYIQIYNEPADHREWDEERPDNYRTVFARRWARHAATVADAGGYPGLQVMGKSELDAVIDAVDEMNRRDIWERAVFVVHNYGVNHPPDYPYDELSQATHPGITIVDDPVSVMMGTAFAVWMQERLGFVIPIVGGEGGWQFGVDDDRRYPRVVQPYHARYHREIFEWFRTGVLSNGEPLPDYYFSMTPWLVSGWNTAEDWWGGPLGDKTETIEAVRAIPDFQRLFSWDDASIATGPAPGVETGPQPEVKPKPEVQPEVGTETGAGSGPEQKPDAALAWDARLDELGVRLTRSDAPSAWRLVRAEYQDPSQAGGRHHVFIKAQDAVGAPIPGVRFLVDWVGRRADETPGYATTNAKGESDYPIFIGMDPAARNGIVFATSADEPGDRVDGMGLPGNQQVAFVLTFQKQE